MGLFGRSSNPVASLTPPGIGGGFTQEQMAMFADAANNSGLTGMGMDMVNSMTGGGINTDEIELMYHLMARHPNEVDLFLVQNPAFLSNLAELIAVIMRKELFAWWNSEASVGTVNAEAAATLGYSTITQENIDTLLGNMVKGTDAQGMETTPQQRINVADAEAIGLINQHKYGIDMNNMQNQQQMYQQQMYNQQMMMQQPQQQGLTGALGSFGSILLEVH